jgi:hypothetical protein
VCLRLQGRFFLTDSGVPIDSERKSKLIRLLRRALSKNMSPSTVLNMLVQTILDVAQTDTRVGANLLCVTIPKKAVPMNDGGYSSPRTIQTTTKSRSSISIRRSIGLFNTDPISSVETVAGKTLKEVHRGAQHLRKCCEESAER